MHAPLHIIDSRRTLELLGLVTFLGLIVRAIALDADLFYSDEAFTWRVCRYDWPSMVRCVAGDVHPVGHFALQKLWTATVGDSPASLRVLSAILGTLGIPLAYLACRLISSSSPWSQWGALLAATLVAFHPLQVEQSRIARMYALGIFLSGVASTTFLYLIQRPSSLSVWSLYGVAVSLFLHTHYFSFFLLCGHAMVVMHRMLVDSSMRTCILRGSGLALLIIVLTYAPWAPYFLAQTTRVEESFWIPPLDIDGASRVFVDWSIGWEMGHRRDAVIIVLVLTVWSCCAVRRMPLSVVPAAEVVVPWIGTVIVSTLFERPLLQDRYMAFSNWSLIVLIGTAASRVPKSIIFHLFVVGNYSLCCLIGLSVAIANRPMPPLPVVEASEFIRAASRPSDLVVVPDARSLNVLMYYMTRFGAESVRIQCTRHEHATGHVNHISSLRPMDYFNGTLDIHNDSSIWIVNGAVTVDNRIWKATTRRSFAPMRTSFEDGISLIRYERISRLSNSPASSG